MNREPSWDDVLAAAARLQRLVPDAVLVGGTAAYRHLEKRWQDWDDIARACEALAVAMLDRLSEESA